ncbi:hypothetical protein BJ170DRAFT_696766 [Xylariales sp. AK1849]|nr:hypothetical protein BJ170DRAFT_696766 [Xylariales sp. AK1849]
MTSHTAAAIAQTVFYVPAVPITLYILIRNWKNGPRMAWYPLLVFSLSMKNFVSLAYQVLGSNKLEVRLAGGITVIRQSTGGDNLGTMIASIILLNVGLIPLIVVTLFLVRFVILSSLPDNRWALQVTIVVRYAIFGAVLLLIASGSLAGNAAEANTQRTLSQVGYIEFTVILCVMIGMLIYLYFRKSQLAPDNIVYVKLTLAITPALLLRTAYGLLYVYTSDDIFATWDPLFGSAVAFTLMALLPEYIILLVYTYLGFYRLRTCHRKLDSLDDSNRGLALEDQTATK